MAAACLRRNQVVDIDGNAYRMVQLLPCGSWELKNVVDGRVDLVPRTKLLAMVGSGTATLRVNDIPADRLAASLRRATDPPVRLVGTKKKAGVVLTESQGELIPQQTLRRRKLKKARQKAKLVAIAEKFAYGCQMQSDAIQSAWIDLSPRLIAKEPHFVTVWRWKEKLDAAGGDVRALVDRDDLKGRKKALVCDDIADLIAEVVEEIYLTRERKNIEAVCDELKWRVKAENALRSPANALEVPPRARVAEYIHALPEFDKHAARYGYQAASRKFRSVLNNVHAERPLQRIELDATRLDLMVTDETGFPMGRPWLHIAMDVRTRCVVGYYISFEPPSLATLFECIRHAVLPKSEVQLAAWGVKSGFPIYGVWETVVMDNAFENHSDALQAIADVWGLDVQFCPRARPWYKGKVERLIGTIVRDTCHGVPGTTFANIFEKDDYDPVKHAVISMSDLQRIVAIYICDVYHRRPHRGLDQESPLSAWLRLVREEDILLPTSALEIEQACRVPDVRRLTHKGIEMLGLFWNSIELEKVRKINGAELDVRVFINRMDLSVIGVEDPTTRKIIEVPVIDPKGYCRKLTLNQHAVIRRFNRTRGANDDIEAMIEGKHLILTIVDEARSLKRFKLPTDVARFIGANDDPPREEIGSGDRPVTASDQVSGCDHFDWDANVEESQGATVTSEQSAYARVRHERKG